MTYITQLLQDLIGLVPQGYEYLEYLFSFLILCGFVGITAFLLLFPCWLIRRFNGK